MQAPKLLNSSLESKSGVHLPESGRMNARIKTRQWPIWAGIRAASLEVRVPELPNLKVHPSDFLRIRNPCFKRCFSSALSVYCPMSVRLHAVSGTAQTPTAASRLIESFTWSLSSPSPESRQWLPAKTSLAPAKCWGFSLIKTSPKWCDVGLSVAATASSSVISWALWRWRLPVEWVSAKPVFCTSVAKSLFHATFFTTLSSVLKRFHTFSCSGSISGWTIRTSAVMT